jgi:hypothetical protein
MRAGFGLASLAQNGVSHSTRWKHFGFLMQALCLCGETYFKGLGLSDTSPFCHGTASSPALKRTDN